jgi:hypothetical protein
LLRTKFYSKVRWEDKFHVRISDFIDPWRDDPEVSSGDEDELEEDGEGCDVRLIFFYRVVTVIYQCSKF